MTSVLDALNNGLQRALTDDSRVVLLGEDILDPYGGAFKVTRGLSTAFPERVLTTPVSEAGMTGLAAGMALRGLRPVVEIMFGDFSTLTVDPLVNTAAKLRWMYNDQVSVPLVVRTPMGGRRGYGPTHSQSIEKLFLGVPGLRVVAASHFGDPGELLYRAILRQDDPLVFVEHKLLYGLQIIDAAAASNFEIERTGSAELFPAYRLTVRGAPPPTLTLAAYGYMAELARQALVKLAYERELFAELIVLTQLAPLDIAPILESANRTGRLLTIEEGTLSAGWGAEVLARCSESLGSRLVAAGRVAAIETPIPAAAGLERRTLPEVDDILRAAEKIGAQLHA